jgi:predicted O-methyltransferase YrrM
MRIELNLGFKDVSPIFWRNIYSQIQPLRHEMNGALAAIESIARRNESLLEHKTGSISYASMVTLFALGFYCRSKVIVEVGTYLGRSGLSLLSGSKLGLAGEAMPRLYTCDMSANEAQFGPLKENVNYFGKTKSTDMFSTLVRQGVKADLVFLDGRLQNEDLPLLRGLLKPETVFAFDDFEGNEKGVYNSNLVLQLLDGELYSIYPPMLADLASIQVSGHSLVAVGLPPSTIKLTRQ